MPLESGGGTLGPGVGGGAPDSQDPLDPSALAGPGQVSFGGGLDGLMAEPAPAPIEVPDLYDAQDATVMDDPDEVDDTAIFDEGPPSFLGSILESSAIDLDTSPPSQTRLDTYDFSFSDLPPVPSPGPQAEAPVEASDFDFGFEDLGGSLSAAEPSMDDGETQAINELLDDLPPLAPQAAEPEIADLPAFEEILDLSGPRIDDLPQRKTVEFGADELDVDAPVDPGDFGIPELPARKLDLGPVDLELDTELPAPKFSTGLPVPKVAPDLPVPKVGPELPVEVAASESLGAIDPDAEDVPVRACHDGNLPVRACHDGNLPVRAQHDGNLPVRKVGADLLAPKVAPELPVPRVGAEVPIPRVDTALPVPRVDSLVPGCAGDELASVEFEEGFFDEQLLGDGLDLPMPSDQIAPPAIPELDDSLFTEIGVSPSAIDSIGASYESPPPLASDEGTQVAIEAAGAHLDRERAADVVETETLVEIDPLDEPARWGARVALAAAALVLVSAGAGGWMLWSQSRESESPSRRHAETGRDGPARGSESEGAEAARAPHEPDRSRVDPDIDALPISTGALVEISAYRKAIAHLELSGNMGPASAARAVELYALGSLEYAGNREWADKASLLARSLGKRGSQSLVVKRARAAARLALHKPNMAAQLETLAKAHPEDARTGYLLGHAYRQKGAISEALDAFNRARTLDPDLLPAWKQLGHAALQSHRVPLAIEAFGHVERALPGVPSVLNGLALAALYQRNYKKAKAQVQAALRAPEERLRVHDRSNLLVTQGRINQAMGHETAAQDRFAEAIRVWPKNIDAVTHLGKLHFSKRRYQDALTLYETLQIEGIKSVKIALEIAESHVALKHPERAMDALDGAIEAFPNNPSLHVRVGDLHALRRRWKPARAAYQKALELDPTHHHAHLKLAEMHAEDGRFEKASEYLRAQIAEHPDSADLHLGLGTLLVRLHDASPSPSMIPSIEAELEQALALDPSLIVAKYHLASVQLLKGRAHGERAMQLLEELDAAGFKQDTTEVRGQAHLHLGQCREAIAAFRSALAREPRNPSLMLLAGQAHFECDESDEARRHLTQALSLDSRLTKAHYLLGRVFLADGNHAAAVQKLESAHQEDKNNLIYFYWLGRALEVNSQRKSAADVYHAVCEAAIHDPRAMIEVCDAFYRRAIGRMEAFDYAGAEGDLRRVVRCDEMRADAWIKWGDIDELRQRHDRAIEKFHEAVKRDQLDAEPHEKIGQAYLLMGEINKAIPELENAMRLSPRNENVLYQLCVIYRDEGRRSKALKHCEGFARWAKPDDPRQGDVDGTIASLRGR